MQKEPKRENKSQLITAMPIEVQEGLARFEELYYSSIESVAPSIQKAVELLQQQSSKHVRPLLLLLVASCYKRPSDQIINGSVFIELLHVSTLVHDDVIDESHVRRGVPSMNAIFDNRKAVLIGDYLLSNAMIQAILAGTQSIVLQLANLGKVLSEGEILQMDTADLGDYSEERYLQIIDRKTASLIESSVKIGAMLAGQEDPQLLSALERAGNLLGRAFQIRDDLFDYLPTPELGKPSGQDIQEHKVTLPLIHALSQPSREREKVLKLLRHESLRRSDIDFVITFAQKLGGIEYATRRMEEMIDQAKEILTEALPACESRDALLLLADYIANRKK